MSVEQFQKWIEPFSRFTAHFSQRQEGKEGMEIYHIFTDRNLYHIVMRFPSDERPKGYLGCQVSSRKPRAGEDWTRGRDLSDGPFNEKTWSDIRNDIIAYELVKVEAAPKVEVVAT